MEYEDPDMSEFIAGCAKQFCPWCGAVYCIIKIPKVADKNGESCISILEKIA